MMKNVKGFAVASDGNMKRIAITYDEIDDSGKVLNSNVKINRVVTDNDVLQCITEIDAFALAVIEAE